MSFRIFLLGLCLATLAVQAEETTPAPAAAEQSPAGPPSTATTRPLTPADLLTSGVPQSREERDAMAQQAQDMRADSQQRKEDAEKTHAAAKTACWKKFLVSACLDDARVEYRQATLFAKKQERKAQALERNVRKFDAAEHIKQRDTENAQREADNARKAEEYKAKQAGKNK